MSEWRAYYLQEIKEPNLTSTTCCSLTHCISTYSHPDQFQLQENTLLATLPYLGEEWQVTFELKPTNLSYTDSQNEEAWSNIFHMTNDANNNWTPRVAFNPARGIEIANNFLNHGSRSGRLIQEFGSQLSSQY